LLTVSRHRKLWCTALARGVTATAMAAAQVDIVLSHLESVPRGAGTGAGGPASGPGGPGGGGALGSLRLVCCGGSTVAPALIQALWAAAPRATYFSNYGMTEAGGMVCSSMVQASEAGAFTRPLFTLT